MGGRRALASLLLAGACAACSRAALAAEDDLLSLTPDASIDLATAEGAASVEGEWRYHDVRIVETGFRAAGPDGQPTGAANRAYDYVPHAGWADFDDSSWERIDATTLEERRTAGKLSFNWYRIRVTVPERVGSFGTRGSTIVFETSLDDYAEIWVDGELPREFAQSGGSVVKGWNAGNRLVIARDVVPDRRSSSPSLASTARSPLLRRTTSGCAPRGSTFTGRTGALPPSPSRSRRTRSISRSQGSTPSSTGSCLRTRSSTKSPRDSLSSRVRSGATVRSDSAIRTRTGSTCTGPLRGSRSSARRAVTRGRMSPSTVSLDRTGSGWMPKGGLWSPSTGTGAFRASGRTARWMSWPIATRESASIARTIS